MVAMLSKTRIHHSALSPAAASGGLGQFAAGGRRAGRRHVRARTRRVRGEVALHGMDGHGTIEVGAVTGHFAGVVADTTVDGREGVVGGQLTPCLLFFVGLDEAQPLLNVFAGWAASITGRKHVEVYGSAGTGGSDAAGRAG